MPKRLPLVLSVTALAISVLGETPLGDAAREAVSQVPPNSVGTAQLKRGAVGTLQLQRSAVTSNKVKNRSLLAVDFAVGQLPKGDKGDKGDKGEKGENGISRVFTNRTSGPTQALTATTTPIISLPLQPGRYLVIGKVWVSGSESNFTAICFTGAGPGGDAGLAASYGGTGVAAVSDTITMQAVVEVSTAVTATISCYTPRAASWGEATLSAIQVG